MAETVSRWREQIAFGFRNTVNQRRRSRYAATRTIQRLPRSAIKQRSRSAINREHNLTPT
ncbi:hypothetical protein [Nonomuraea jabiensis]|uniref:hypothetical protein n=1 Tax=Nonomuraea jabiensis TaxID=882448 RepID=UPI003D73C4D4